MVYSLSFWLAASYEIMWTSYPGFGASVEPVGIADGSNVLTLKNTIAGVDVALGTAWITAGIGVPPTASLLLASTDAWLRDELMRAIATRVSCSFVMFSSVSVVCVNACLKRTVDNPSTNSMTPKEMISSGIVKPR